ncbi:TIR domain-containing protein, partial [Patescibacteria group bacterium]|nr:TIR domain-containing protein [Patescibacteria group bacterium]
MNNPRTFVSFDYDHNDQSKIRFVGQSKNSKTPFFIQDWSSRSSLPQSQWEKIVKEKINKCNILIVLVGKFMASASGVVKEIAMAEEQNVPFFGVYVGGADQNSRLPSGLKRNRTIKWTWDGVADAIDQLMSEGKN